MATVFKRPGRKNWIAQWFSHDRTQRFERSTGTTDRKLAERLAQRWENREIERREGLIDVRAEAMAAHQATPLERHLSDFLLYLESKGTSAQTVDTAEARIRAILTEGKINTIHDLLPASVLAAVKRLRGPGVATAKGLSNKTASHYITAIKGFGRWLFRDKRAASDDLVSLQGFNEQTDRRRVRRDLQPDEVARVLAVAAESDIVKVERPYRTQSGERRTGHVRMKAPHRAWAYRVAAETGFRASEVASLVPESFDLDAEPPTIKVEAAYSKHKRTDVQPIRMDFAEELRRFLQGKAQGTPLFPLPQRKAALLVRADIETARARWIAEAESATEQRRREQSDFLRHTDSQGRVVDFHGLRHTFISQVVRTGASVKVAQELARHSTPTLTIGLYSHTRREDLAAALENLPVMGSSRPNSTSDLRTSARQGGGTSRSDHQHQHQHCVPEAVPDGTTACETVQRPPTNKARVKSSQNGALREPVRRGASDFQNAEGRTRTADLRVMNPAL
jgi:integrase